MIKKFVLLLLLTLFSACSHNSDLDFTKLIPSIIRFKTISNKPLGSGSIIKHPKLGSVIITNYHVCKAQDLQNTPIGESLASYSFNNQRELNLGKILLLDIDHDLCAVKLNVEGLQANSLALEMKPYEKLVVVGFPSLHSLSPSYGYPIGRLNVSLFLGFEDGMHEYDLIETNIIGFPGNSGSAVFNMNGEIVGILNSGNNFTHYIMFVPLEHLKFFLERL